MSADLTCPGCFKRVGGHLQTCPECGAAVWADGRLALVGPIEEGRPGLFRGLLRGDDGRLEDVAVKVLDVGGLPNWRDYDRFRRQNEILSSLAHPRIPRARGDFEVGTRVLQCQTLIGGRSLARHLRGARLTPAEVTRLAIELLEVLEYLHGRDVVHRDIKPDNVVIDGDGTAHLIDFGAARRLHAPADKIDPEPTVVGTPGYMAPEQTRGEAVAQSDLYALGRLLGEALGGARAEPLLAALLPQLTREDWRKRPASAAAALKVLRPTLVTPRQGLWPVVAGLSIALVTIIVVVRVHANRRPAAAAAAAETAATAAAPVAAEPDGPSLDSQARALLDEWALAQHERDMDRYGRCYAPEFKGVRRTPGGKVLSLDRAEWLKDRARINSQPIDIQTDDIYVRADDDAGTATITLLQRFRRGNYAEHGLKRFVARRAGAGMVFTSEEMLDSKRGWDDDEYASQVPMQAADCRIAFDPSDHKYLVTLAHDEDYTEALRAAARARRAKRAAEIVWGPAFTGLGPGFWVLAGALDDESKASALAARVGGEVREAALAPQPGQGIARLIARRALAGLVGRSTAMFTVVNGLGYAVMRGEITTFALTEPELPSIRKLGVPAGGAVRLVEHEGAAHLLDGDGHWYRIGETALTREPSFDPSDGAGRSAKFGSLMFELDGVSAEIRGAVEETLHWPLPGDHRGLFKVSDDRLAVLRDDELFVFAVGPPKPRLTKLCLAVESQDHDDQIAGPAGITLGPMRLVTDRAGKLDVWTDEWGFVKPAIEVVSNEDPVLRCRGEDLELILRIEEVAFFRQASVLAKATAECAEMYGD
jgi:hypothetical protein